MLGDGGHSWATSLENNNPICFVNEKLITILHDVQEWWQCLVGMGRLHQGKCEELKKLFGRL